MGLLDSVTQQQYYSSNDFGNYQFTSLDDIINQFMMVYVGEDKIIPKAKRLDVAFHAQRALAELSFDTFKSCKSQEITVQPNLQMILPQDYVNYTKVSWVDSAGIKHLMYPTSKTSNPKTKLPGEFNDARVGYEHLDNQEIAYVINAKAEPQSGGNIVLDDVYTNIVVGMELELARDEFNLTGGTFTVEGVTHSSTETTVIVDPLFSGTDGNQSGTPAVFSFTDGAPIIPVSKINVISVGFHHDALNYINTVTDGTNDDPDIIGVPAVKKGDIISSYYYPVGTVVQEVINRRDTVSLSSRIIPSNPIINNGGVNIFGGEIIIYSPDYAAEYESESTTWANYKSGTPSENQDDYQDDTYWPMDGERYGLDPQHAQANGSFYIDCVSGKIHFSSNISGKTVILDYISDSLGTDEEMQVHKFAEEAMYRWISHAIMAGRANIPEYQVNRFKKERFAAIRTAKLRLSNIKLEEITQILRGKSKQIKH